MSIKIDNLNYKYMDNMVFEDLNLTFKENLLHGILGPNGCGKTTLLKTILKLLKVDNDEIFIDKDDINNLNREQIAKKIAYVEQSSKLMPHISVKEYIHLSRYLFDDFNQSENLIVNEVIKLIKLEHFENQYVDQLSGGELQKVVIARALAQQTKIIILDEPTANLDPLHQIEIMNLLKYLVKEKGITIIVSLHDINLSLEFCDEIVLIKNNTTIQGKSGKIINKENIKKYFNLNSEFIINPLTNAPYVILNLKND